MRTTDHPGIPLHTQVRTLIIDGIRHDRLQPGAPLPGEHRMCEFYGVSRTVVRQALAQLERDGIVERIKGKGTYVAQPQGSGNGRPLLGLLEDAGRTSGHVNVDVRYEQVPADDEIAAALGVNPGTPVAMIERLGRIDGEPWSISRSWSRE